MRICSDVRSSSALCVCDDWWRWSGLVGHGWMVGVRRRASRWATHWPRRSRSTSRCARSRSPATSRRLVCALSCREVNKGNEVSKVKRGKVAEKIGITYQQDRLVNGETLDMKNARSEESRNEHDHSVVAYLQVVAKSLAYCGCTSQCVLLYVFLSGMIGISQKLVARTGTLFSSATWAMRLSELFHIW